MAKKKKQDETPEQTAGKLAIEIWGIIFAATGVLVLTGIISAYTGQPDNILGPLGSRLSLGLFYLFGQIPALLIPLAIIATGILQIRGKLLQLRTVLYWVIFTFEICVLFATHKLTAISPQDFDIARFLSNNFVGSFVIWLLHHVFGVHTFGPYFLFTMAVLVTVLAGLHINVRTAALLAGAWLASLGRWIAGGFKRAASELASPPPNPPSPPSAPLAAQAEESTKKRPRQRKTLSEKESGQPSEPAAGTPAIESEPSELPPEEAARKRLDEELAAFRARKNEPVKITTEANAGEDAHANGADDRETPEDDPDEVLEPPADEVLLTDRSESAIVEDDDAEPEVDLTDASKVGDGEFRPKEVKLPEKPYKIPDPAILSDPPPEASTIDRTTIEDNTRTLEQTLLNFGVEGKVVNVSPGPVINRYEIELAPGIKVSKVVNLQDDISMAVGGQKIRIQAPIPGKAAIGIELPTPERRTVHFKNILLSDTFRKSKAKLPIIIGKTISGLPFVTDITRMPHLLIAGQTGSGKSVCINSIICSLLMTRTPEELRMIMIDPKKVELASYEGIPHLMSPVVTESKEAVRALQWGVIEMERRYRLLAKVGARNIDSFNTRLLQGKVADGVIPDDDNKQLPFIVILVDELADLMMTASRDVEGLIQRIAQLARAVGIHLIVATQRPSVDIITGPIKANLTSRIAFRTIQSTDSRTILGHVGAEKLLGMGDMLFLRNGAPDIERFHGAFITEENVEVLVNSIREQYVEIDTIQSFEQATSGSPTSGFSSSDDSGSDRDELFVDAAEIIVTTGQGSTSMLQRRMKIGYARAGRLMDELEKAGIVGPQDGSKPRDVFVEPDELREHLTALGIVL